MRPIQKVERNLYIRGRLAIGLTVVGGILAPTGWLIAAVGVYEPLGAAIFITGWGLIAGSVAFFGAFEQLATMRMIQDLPTARIQSAHQGYVELQGIVCESRKFITCPQCGESCLWFECHQGKRNRVTPAGPTPDIVLDDDTGHCLVKAAGSELYATDDYSGHVHINPGDTLHVLGEFRSLSAASPGAATPEAREQKVALRKRLEALKRDAGRMALFDRNKDGTVDSREWDAAVRATGFQLAREPAPVPEWRPDYVVARPTTEADRLPFVIFVGTEEAAITRARREFIRRLVLAGLFGLAVAVFALTLGATPAKRHKARAAAPPAAELLSRYAAAAALPRTDIV